MPHPVIPEPTPVQSSFAKLAGTATAMLVALTLLTGVAYPLLVTGIAKVIFPRQAAGSLVEGATPTGLRGSELVGQAFEGPQYFWGRLSATSPMPFNAGASTGSNLGPTNEGVAKAARERVEALRAADPSNTAPIPVDLVTSSGSGLDPHITPAGAHYQVDRVARVRGLPVEHVRELVRFHTEERTFGILGEPRVNVALLNLALDRTTRAPPATLPNAR